MLYPSAQQRRQAGALHMHHRREAQPARPPGGNRQEPVPPERCFGTYLFRYKILAKQGLIIFLGFLVRLAGSDQCLAKSLESSLQFMSRLRPHPYLEQQIFEVAFIWELA